ncbi:MAG TPA: ABC transporter permease [Candidatus Dormibacteraeota bacterium]|nr:ABC transporter permease [Candidatus Dormibacteraeota bacterium]
MNSVIARFNVEGRGWRPVLIEFLAEYGFLVFFGIWVVYLSVSTVQFLTPSNLLIVLRQASIFGIPAIGATFVMIIGEIDISFGSLLGLSGAVGASLIVGGKSPLVGFVAAVAVGALVGLINGLLVTVVRIPSVVATLGMLTALLGFGLWFTSGQSYFGSRLDPIIFLAEGYWGPIPVPVVLLFVAYVLGHLLLSSTVFGRWVYLAGDNQEAAYRSGIPVRKIKIAVFIVAGVLTGIGGMILVGRVGQASASLGSEALFPVLTAVILGGVGLTGGKGNLWNTLIASVFLASIVNGLILVGADPNVQQIAQGGILIAALSLDRLRK